MFRKKMEWVDTKVLILNSRIMGKFIFLFFVCVYTFYTEFIPFIMRRNTRAKVKLTSCQRKHFCMSLSFIFSFSSSRFWHHALICGPSFHSCLYSLNCGGDFIAGENGEEVCGAEEEEQVRL